MLEQNDKGYDAAVSLRAAAGHLVDAIAQIEEAIRESRRDGLDLQAIRLEADLIDLENGSAGFIENL